MHNLNPMPGGFKNAPAESKLLGFKAQIQGDLNAARVALAAYDVVQLPIEGKLVTLAELNHGPWLLRLVTISIVSQCEWFLRDLCRRVLLTKHELLNNYPEAKIGPKQLMESSDPWEALVELVLNGLQSGRLSTFRSILRGAGVDLPARGTGDGDALEELILRRNVVTHNRGVPDAAYLAVVNDPAVYPSGGLVFDIGYLNGKGDMLIRVGHKAVEQAVSKGFLGKDELRGF